MKDRFSEACCRLVMERPETSHDNFLRDFGERFVPGYKPVSTVDSLINAPFDEWVWTQIVTQRRPAIRPHTERIRDWARIDL